jgi:polyhydroxybutyrate depolymerase
LTVEDASRSYIVYQPALTRPDKVPLMVVLHGGLGNAESIEKISGMNGVADSGQFIVAYPDGTSGPLLRNRRTWNAGRCCGKAVEKNVDDVGILESMINEIVASYPVDASRIYVTGHSNGAMMAYRLAAEIPGRLAAIMPVAGTLAIDDCDKGKDVAVLHIHGDSDNNVPFAGGEGARGVSGGAHRSVAETIRLVTLSRRSAAPERSFFPPNFERLTYRCAEGAPVELLTIKGGGHPWPAGASQIVWEYAKKFSRSLDR